MVGAPRRLSTFVLAAVACALATSIVTPPAVAGPSKSPSKPAFPKQLKGTFSGSESKDGVSLTWNGTVTLTYQRDDPILHRPWGDGQVHYVATGGNFVWTKSGTSVNGCVYSGGNSEKITDKNYRGQFVINQTKSKAGWEWESMVGPDPVTIATFPVTTTCPGAAPVTDQASAHWIQLFNGQDGDVHPTNIHTKDLVTFKSNCTNDQGNYKQQWIMSLKGSGRIAKP